MEAANPWAQPLRDGLDTKGWALQWETARRGDTLPRAAGPAANPESFCLNGFLKGGPKRQREGYRFVSPDCVPPNPHTCPPLGGSLGRVFCFLVSLNPLLTHSAAQSHG